MTRLLPLLCLLLAACIDTSDDESSADERGADDGGVDAPPGSAGWADGCEEAEDIVIQRYRECDIAVDTGDGDEDVECTDELAAQSLCIAACIEDAPCKALDGTDADAALALSECYVACV